jgi:hypothetical protein
VEEVLEDLEFCRVDACHGEQCTVRLQVAEKRVFALSLGERAVDSVLPRCPP